MIRLLFWWGLLWWGVPTIAAVSSSTSTTTSHEQDDSSSSSQASPPQQQPQQQFTRAQQEQLFQLEQAIASSSDPQQTLQQVAQANQMSASDLMQLLQQNRHQMQQPSGFLLPKLAQRLMSLVLVLLTNVLSMLMRLFGGRSSSSSGVVRPRPYSRVSWGILATMAMMCMYGTFLWLVARPRNGWMISNHHGILLHRKSHGPTTFWIPPPTFVQQQVFWENSKWWSSLPSSQEEEDEDEKDDTTTPWRIPLEWLERNLSDGMSWLATTNTRRKKVETGDNIDDDEVEEEDEEETKYDTLLLDPRIQSAVVIQKTIRLEDIVKRHPLDPPNPITNNRKNKKKTKTSVRHSKKEEDDDAVDNDLQDDGLLGTIMYHAAIKTMKGPLRWTAATTQLSLPYSFQLLSEPMDTNENEEENDDDQDNRLAIQQQQTIQRALVILPKLGDWNRCALQPLWMVPDENDLDHEEEDEEDNKEEREQATTSKKTWNRRRRTRVTFLTCPHGHFDGQVQCILQSDPTTGQLQLRLYVLVAKPSSSQQQQQQQYRSSKRLQHLLTTMATYWMQAWYETLIPVLQQQYVRQQQSRHFASRYHEQALHRRRIRQHVAEQLEDMAAERRRKWQRNNPNAGSYRPSGPRIPHFSGSTSAITTI